jgi:hypothetical protein
VFTVRFLVLLLASGILAAQNDKTDRPAYKLLRYEEDWSSLRDPSSRTEWLDRLKYITLGQKELWYLTIWRRDPRTL